MTAQLRHDLILAGGATLLLGLVLAAVDFALLRLGADRLLARKIPHALCGTFAAAAAFRLSSLTAIVAVLAVATVALVVVVEKRLLPDVLDGTRVRDYGLVGFSAGALIAAVAFWPDRIAIAAGLLVLGLADAGAALAGRYLGRHRVAAGGALRSLEGSTVFVAITFAVSLAITVFGIGCRLPVAVGISVFVALSTAAIELLVPPAVDNLLITPWVAVLVHQAATLAPADALRWFAAAALACPTVPFLVRMGWLDVPGAVGGTMIAAVALALGGVVWLVPAVVFFVITSLLTRIGRKRRGSLRGLSQVMVNAGVPVGIPVLAYAMSDDPIWFAVSIGGLAAAIADSWASEIGRFSRREPVSLRTLRRVAKGTSGAVSPLGLAATVLGGTAVGSVGALLVSQPALVVVGVIAGLAGSLMDSLVGATAEARYRCPACDQVTEERIHCDVVGRLHAGSALVHNDTVNTIANLTGMAIGFGAYGVGCGLF